jgi:hypothetical protein
MTSVVWIRFIMRETFGCDLMHIVAKISEVEFARLCEEITADSDSIVKHNPIGTREEILLWMLLSVLVSYLSLEEIETPCFNGKPVAETYREAIAFVLKGRKKDEFEEEIYLNNMLKDAIDA